MTDEFTGLGLLDLLNLLEPVPDPAAIVLTPQTPGWIVVGLALLAVIGWGTRRALGHWQANAYRRAALSELPMAGNDPRRIALVLRRTALAGFPRHQVAGLYGTDWLGFLDQTLGGTGFTDGPGQGLATAPYRNATGQNPTASPELAALAHRWIKQHKREGP